MSRIQAMANPLRHQVKRIALTAARGSGALALLGHLTRKRLRILAYHGAWILPEPLYGDKLFMPIAQFRARMQWLRRSPYRLLGLEQALNELDRGMLSDNSVVITIDDGWQSTYSHMLPVLEEFKIPATLYVTTWYVQHALPVLPKLIEWMIHRGAQASAPRPSASAVLAAIESRPLAQRMDAVRDFGESLGIDPQRWQGTGQFELMTPGQIQDAQRRGLDIQLHTHRHQPLAGNSDRLAGEIAENRRYLQGLLPGHRLNHFCYPSGSYDPAAPQVLATAGVRSATLSENGLNDRHSHRYRLNRLIDGASISQSLFEAWLAGLSDCFPRRPPGSAADRQYPASADPLPTLGRRR